MSVIFYAPKEAVDSRRLEGVVEGLVPEEMRNSYETIGALTERLRQPREDVGIAVLLAATRETLSEIHAIKDLLEEILIIMVLPDREEDTVARGHALRPRFMTYIDSDFGEIAAVLSKMLSKSGSIRGKSGKLKGNGAAKARRHAGRT